MKFKFKFWCSNPRIQKLYVKLLTKLVSSSRIYKAIQATNARANAATKML